MTPTRGLRFDITGLVGEITLRECDGGHTWQCYISSLICKTAWRRWCSTALRSRVDEVNYRRSITGLHAALAVNMPNYATAILSAEEIFEAISKSTA